MAIALAALLLQASTVGVTPETTMSDPCAIFLKPVSSPVKRKVTTDDLAKIADIGRSDAYDSATPLGPSPDGKSVAFVVRRGNPQANSYCQQLLVVRTSGGASPVELDRGGEFIRDPLSIWGLTGLKAGWPLVVAPKWSPDGSTIAYLKRINGSTQVWTIRVATGERHLATHGTADIDDFTWADGGEVLITASRPGVISARQQIEEEGRKGYLYNERFSPMQSSEPIPLDPIPETYQRVELGSGRVVLATPSEMEMLGVRSNRDASFENHRYEIRRDGEAVWVQKQDSTQILSADMLVQSLHDGSRRFCRDSPCTSISGFWWPPGQDILFEARFGWGKSQTGLFRWRRGEGKPKPILETNDALVGCVLSGPRLICAREGAVSPRRIVAIDIHTGRQKILYDPNPGFPNLALGSVHRFTFDNAFGVECYADLVLPPDHRPGQKHPLVVVQYSSDGFLRGGTGDEVPIQALAAKGFAVLSFNRPSFVPAAQAATSDIAMRLENRKQWIDRRSVQSALETAVRLSIATGAVDADHMGITGLSDGASTTQWALINSSFFKAAAIGSCCEDRYALPLNGGPGYAAYLREMGYPPFDASDPGFWRPLSLSLNADRLNTPLLIQASDAEYQIALDTVEALRERNKAIEMRVYPNEVHVKWQPAHRLAMYNRVVAWFSFWLKDEVECGSGQAADYRRWIDMTGAPSIPELKCDDGAPLRP